MEESAIILYDVDVILSLIVYKDNSSYIAVLKLLRKLKMQIPNILHE